MLDARGVFAVAADRTAEEIGLLVFVGETIRPVPALRTVVDDVTGRS